MYIINYNCNINVYYKCIIVVFQHKGKGILSTVTMCRYNKILTYKRCFNISKKKRVVDR